MLPAMTPFMERARKAGLVVAYGTREPNMSKDYETAIGFYQILNQGSGNLTNEPLKRKASTLSRTDMITLQ
jgi:hypothetical protein